MEDYTPVNDLGWNLDIASLQVQDSTTTTPQHEPRKAPNRPMLRPSRLKKIRPPPNFADGNSDDSQTAAWRRNDGPSATVVVPKNAKIPTGQELTMVLFNIARQTGTHVTEIRTLPRQVRIWGPLAQVETAKLQVTALIEDRDPGSKDATRMWSKIRSMTDQQRRIHDEKIEEDWQKEEFRRAPLPDSVFETIGSFAWPGAEYRPEDILGTTFEALDAIRMQYRCYIVYDTQKSHIKVMGKCEDVQKALCRIRAVCYQVAARQVPPTTSYLLHWSDTASIKPDVRLVDYIKPIIVHPQTIQQPDAAATIAATGDPAAWEELAQRQSSLESQTRLNARKLKDRVIHILKKVKYYKGNLTMRARLGTFVLGIFQMKGDGVYQLSDFEDMLTEPIFTGIVTDELGRGNLEAQLLSRCQSSNLVPHMAFVKNLEDIKPSYVATLTVGNDAGDIQLSKTWEENGGDYDCASTRWSRLEKGSPTSNSLLAVSLVDPADGLAWQVEITATQTMEEARVPTSLRHLSDWYWKFNAQKAASEDPRAIWVDFTHPVNDKKSLLLRTEWRYGIPNSDYSVLVAKVKNVTYRQRDLTRTGMEQSMEIEESRWGVSVVHRKWEALFDEHANLAIGAGARWRPDLPTWFPADSVPGQEEEPKNSATGVESFVEKLMMIKSIARGDAEEL